MSYERKIENLIDSEMENKGLNSSRNNMYYWFENGHLICSDKYTAEKIDEILVAYASHQHGIYTLPNIYYWIMVTDYTKSSGPEVQTRLRIQRESRTGSYNDYYVNHTLPKKVNHEKILEKY